MLHIPGKSMTLIEVEKEAIEPVYHFLKSRELTDVFINPSKAEISRYVNEAQSPIVVIPLITKAPVNREDKTILPTLEKLMVDLFCDKDLFIAYQGTELSHIFNMAYSRYAIDLTRLFSYAERRRKRDAIRTYLAEKTDIPVNLRHDRT